MAGIAPFLPKENTDLSEREGLFFTFNYEGESLQFTDISNSSSESSYLSVTGDFEFAKQNKFAYWRNIVPVLLLAVVSVVAYNFGIFDKKDISASILKSELMEDKSAATVEIPFEIEQFASINEETPKVEVISNVVETPTELEIIAESTSSEQETPVVEAKSIIPVEKIEQTEKTELMPKVEKASVVETPEVALPTPAIKKPKVFKTNSLADAKTMSTNTGRYIFIKFGADWCAPCKLMESTAMQDEQVKKLLKEKYIVLDVDVDKLDGYKIKEEFYVERLPTLIILDDLGNQMKREENALGTIGLIKMLESMTPYIYLEEEELTANMEDDLNRGER